MLYNSSLFSQMFSLLSLFFIVSLSIVVLKNSRRLVNWLFFLLTIVLDLWIFGSFMMISSAQESQIIFWDRFVYAAVVFWPSFQYHFSLAVTYTDRQRRNLLAFAYTFSFIFLFLSQTNLFVKGIFHYAWGAHTKAQTLHHFFIGAFFLYSILFFYNLLKKYKAETSALEKKRVAYYILGFIVLDFIGGTAFLPAYSIPFYPIFLATPLIFSLVITYAIVYFGLMDIKLIIRRYLVYFFSIISLIMPSYIIICYVYLFHPLYLSFAFLGLFFISISVFPRTKGYFYRFSNKYLFSSLYDFNELIYNLNNRLRASLDIKQIFESTTDLLLQAFHSKAIAVLYYEEEAKYWTILFNQGFALNSSKIELHYETVSKLLGSGKPLDIMRIKHVPPLADKKVLTYLQRINAEILVPVNIEQKKLSSILIFGPKESEEIYNRNDIRVLESIAAEIGISLENALLYRSVTKFNLKLRNEINKATRKLKEQNDSLKQLDKAKDEFIGIASHQLRTPLTGIRWLAELLLKNKEKNLSDKQLKFLRQLNESNQKMIRLVSDLLDVSHIETGRKFDINKNYFYMDGAIAEVLKENVFLISTKKLKIKNKLPADLNVWGDREKIKQVWQNLISNATKYSKNNSEIELNFKKDKKQGWIFFVKDHGVGIPKEQHHKIFTKFFRANNASLQDSDGTGLGLYIAREIMRAHKGDIWFDSALGQGSTFYFSLPLMLDKKDKNNLKTIKIKKKTNKS